MRAILFLPFLLLLAAPAWAEAPKPVAPSVDELQQLLDTLQDDKARAQFVGLQADLSDHDSHLNFTIPSAQDFARAIERFGIGDGSLKSIGLYRQWPGLGKICRIGPGSEFTAREEIQFCSTPHPMRMRDRRYHRVREG